MKITTLFHRLKENSFSFLMDLVFEDFSEEQFDEWLNNNEGRLDSICEKYKSNVEILVPEQLIRIYLSDNS